MTLALWGVFLAACGLGSAYEIPGPEMNERLAAVRLNAYVLLLGGSCFTMLAIVFAMGFYAAERVILALNRIAAGLDRLELGRGLGGGDASK
jgi:predicted membrane-bound spermidine synthase